MNPLGQSAAWDLVAGGYAATLLPQFEPFSREALRLAEIKPPAEILDVATGPGTLALLAAPLGRVTAIDWSSAMIAQLAARAASAGAEVNALVGNAQALPFGGGRFDRVFCLFGLMFFPDRRAGLRELARVVRARGRVVVATWAPFEGLIARAAEAIDRHAGLPGDMAADAPLAQSAELEAELRAAGFADVVVHQVTRGLPFASIERFWLDEQTTPPVARLRGALGEAVWSEVSAKVAADLQREYGAGPVMAPATALFGVASV